MGGNCAPLPPIGGGALQNLMEGGGRSSQCMGGAWGGLKMLSKTCEGVHLIVKLLAKSLQAVVWGACPPTMGNPAISL